MHPKLHEAVDVYLRYYDATEMFDLAHCSGRSPKNGHAIPLTGEHWVCARNAREQAGIAEGRLDELHVPREIRQQAKDIASAQHELKP